MTITTLSLPDATELLHRARDLEWDLTNDFERMTREKFEFELPALFGDLSRAIKEHREEARA
ncbi:hypothetical protein, partial [Arthrobacter sp. SAFR-014]|uniref:hypothetical protein n=1 Tax=Arthrobacter sp. SAFR-014 TaxID=3387280 RepID=UPI003F7C4C54